MKKVIFQKKSDILTIICRIDLSGLVCRLCLGHLSVLGRWRARSDVMAVVAPLYATSLLAIRLRDRKGRAILCIALSPRYGDSSGAILGVRSVALLHGRLSVIGRWRPRSNVRRSCSV